MEKMKKDLDNRGGSKKEGVHDIAARKKWNMRVNAIMDQKANSIADLAAVMIQHEETRSYLLSSSLQQRDRERDIMIKWADQAQAGRLDFLKQEWESKSIRAKGEKKKGTRRALYTEIAGLKRRHRDMQYASRMVELAKWWADLPEEQRTTESLDAHLLEAEPSILSADLDQMAYEQRKALNRLNFDKLAFQTWNIVPSLETPSDAENGTAVAPASSETKSIAQPDFSSSVYSLLRQADASSDEEDLEDAQEQAVDIGEGQETTDKVSTDSARDISTAAAETDGAKSSSGLEASQKAANASADIDSSESRTGAKTSAEGTNAAANALKRTRDRYLQYVPPYPLNFESLIVEKNLLSGASLELHNVLEHRRTFLPCEMQDVTVHWDNLLDAEFAENWPSAVNHEPLGTVRLSKHPSPEELLSTQVTEASLEDEALSDEAVLEDERQLEDEASQEDEASPEEQAPREVDEALRAQKKAEKRMAHVHKKAVRESVQHKGVPQGQAVAKALRRQRKKITDTQKSTSKTQIHKKRMRRVQERKKAGLPVERGYKGPKTVFLDIKRMRGPKKTIPAA